MLRLCYSRFLVRPRCRIASWIARPEMLVGLTVLSCVCNSQAMRRGRLALLFSVAALFLNSLDCYGAWMMSSQARDCCRKGHCAPSKGDSCCNNSLAQSGLALQARDQAPPAPQVATSLPGVASTLATAALPTANRIEAPVSGLPPPLDPIASPIPLLI